MENKFDEANLWLHMNLNNAVLKNLEVDKKLIEAKRISDNIITAVRYTELDFKDCTATITDFCSKVDELKSLLQDNWYRKINRKPAQAGFFIADPIKFDIPMNRNINRWNRNKIY